LFGNTWKPVEVNMEIAELELPLGAVTAGVRRGAKSDTSDLGRAVKAWSGEAPEHFITGGLAFSMTDFVIRDELKEKLTRDHNLQSSRAICTPPI
jgi:hypothetical protein